jgi:ketosteroid isomerase-like protein
MTATRVVLDRTYAAFNARDIDTVLAVMHPDVDWPNSMEGGRVLGQAAVRAYWVRRWALIDPRVEPRGFTIEADGRVAVAVHQVVRDLAGTVLKESTVRLRGRPDQVHGDPLVIRGAWLVRAHH